MGLLGQRRQRRMHDLVVGKRGGQFEMQCSRHAVGLQQILREGIQPALQRLRVSVSDMRRNDFSLFQMNLLEFIDLIDGGGEQRFLHQQQMIVGLDPHNGIDNVFQTRGIALRRSDTDPVPFSPLVVRCKTCRDACLLIEDSAAVQNRARHQSAQLVARREHARRQQNVQTADHRPKRLHGKRVLRKRQWSKSRCAVRLRRQMPELVIIVFRMGLPDEDEPIAVFRFLHAVAEILPDVGRLGRNLKMSQQRLEFHPTGWTLCRRVGHAKCFIVHMGRGPQPSPDRLVRAFV